MTSKDRQTKKCKDETIERKVASMLEESKESLYTHGSGSNTDIHEWTRTEFPNPTLLPNFKLQPIVKLFSDQFMHSDR